MALLISDPLRCGDKDDGVAGRLMAHTSKRSAGRALAAAVVVMLAVVGLVCAAAAIVYGWLMSILARHIGDGVGGALEVCLLILMGAIGVALIAGGAWATLQTRTVRRRLR